MTEEKKEELKTEETQTDIAPSVEEKDQVDPNADLQTKLEEEQKKRADLEANMAKIEEERDNYRQGMLSAKAKKISLSDDDIEPVAPTPLAQPVQPQVTDEAGWDEVDKRAEAKANAIYTTQTKKQEKENEQIAIKKFMASHPELVSSDATMQGVKEEYTNKHGKSIEGINMDLERAYKYYKLDRNIPVEKPEVNTAANELASQPTPQGSTPTNVSGFNDFEQKYIQDEFSGDVNKFKAYKEAILSGMLEVPESIINSFS